MEVFGITFKRFHLPAPSELIPVHIVRTHEYINAEWCSKNAKAPQVMEGRVAESALDGVRVLPDTVGLTKQHCYLSLNAT